MFDLIQVFMDTETLCKTDSHLIGSIKNTISHQYVVSESDSIVRSNAAHRFDKPADVKVSMKRTFEAASAYKNEKVCVLNFASATHPGGGVRNGARAQEECLCRCSTLYFALSEGNTWNSFYSKHYRMLRSKEMSSTYNDDCIYSPGITVFKTDTQQPVLAQRSQWFDVNVLTCAAPNLSFFYGSADTSADKLRKIHTRRAKRILDIALKEENDVIILGAFGCGAFHNPPEIVADVYREVISDYLYDFKVIEFAIVSNPDKPSENYLTFSDMIGK